jgi:hypothetical protein
MLAIIGLSSLFQNCGSGFTTSYKDLENNAQILASNEPIRPPLDPSAEPAVPPAPAPTPAPPPGTFALTIAKSGSGSVTSNLAGINCGNDCNEAYANNTSITLIATPEPGFIFKGWGGSCNGMSTSCTLVMSAARNVLVTFESAAGTPASVDAVIAAMPTNSWKSLPGTQMKDVCPTPYNGYACWSVIGAWSGGAYDEKRERMIVYGGGHADSWYNNVFAFDLASMKWLRLSEMPAGAGEKPPPGWTDKRTETCGYYTKGVPNIPAELLGPSGYVLHDKCFVEPVLSQLDFQQPRSPHSYGGVFVDRLKDRYCSLEGQGFPSGQAIARVVNCFDPATGQWSRIADRPNGIGTYGQTALDSFGHVWSVPSSGGYVSEYDPVANAWTTYGYANYESGGGTDIDRKRNQLYVLYPQSTGAYSVRRWDLTSPSSLRANQTYTQVISTGDIPTTATGERPGFAYADAKDLFFLWGGGRDVYTFDSNTAVWKRHSPTGDDPGVQQKWGNYGRFRYSPKHRVVVLVNDTSQNVFIYKPAN